MYWPLGFKVLAEWLKLSSYWAILSETFRIKYIKF